MDPKMEAQLLKLEAAIRADLANALQPLTLEIQQLKIGVNTMEVQMSEIARLQGELADARRVLEKQAEELRELQLWRAGFAGEKGVKDETASRNDQLYRKVAAALLVALILGAAGWVWDRQSNPGLTQEQVQQLLDATSTQRPGQGGVQ